MGADETAGDSQGCQEGREPSPASIAPALAALEVALVKAIPLMEARGTQLAGKAVRLLEATRELLRQLPPKAN